MPNFTYRILIEIDVEPHGLGDRITAAYGGAVIDPPRVCSDTGRTLVGMEVTVQADYDLVAQMKAVEPLQAVDDVTAVSLERRLNA